MNIWLQNLLVLLAVGGSTAFLLRGVVRALRGRKSSVGGCGVCSGCVTTQPATKPAADRIVMVPIDALARSSRPR
jgi:hypothetical protein